MDKRIVLVTACSAKLGNHPYHTVQFKYVDAVAQGAGCAPLVLPALGSATDIDSVLAAAHGVMLTGSPSNVDPRHYGQTVHNPALPQDVARDATTLPLIRAVVDRGIPLLAVCRGFQEVNVALGGTLHQAVQEVPGYMDHREDPTAPLDEQYGPAHSLELPMGGLLAGIMEAPRITVNSLHGQGLDRLAPSLVPEAYAEDGLVEAFSCPTAKGFVLGVQWHPEWRVMENADSRKLFAAFGDACRQYQQMVHLRVP
jgi:putative glutamine amidotransferase